MNSPPEDNPQFRKHYGLEHNFNIIAGIDFIIRFYGHGGWGGPKSTYINYGLFNIVGEFNIAGGFKKKIITALRNIIRPEIISLEMTGEARRLCEERNRKLGFRTIQELGIDNDNNDPPNDLLKKMLDEYLECYNDLWELAIKSVVKK